MPGSNQVIREVANYCWSHKFLDVFQKFFKDYAFEFIDAPETLAEGEHDLKYHSLFTKYLDIYEQTLTDYLQTLDTSIEDFYAAVRECDEDDADQYIGHFIKCLLASMNYESFYRVMAKEGKKKKIELELTGAESKPNIDKADAKSNDDGGNSSPYKSDGKGTDDVDTIDNDNGDFKGEGKSTYK